MANIWDSNLPLKFLEDQPETAQFYFERDFVIAQLKNLEMDYLDDDEYVLQDYDNMTNKQLEDEFCSTGLIYDYYCFGVINNQAKVAKLTSAAIVSVITNRIATVPYISFEPADLLIAQKALSWKRNSKMKMTGAIKQYMVKNIDEFLESCDDLEYMNTGRNSINEKCVVRHFVIPDLTLVCTVISDELDQNILALMWHQD